MDNTIKTCDLSIGIASMLFYMLNSDRVMLEKRGNQKLIDTDVEPKKLLYPEGWYYALGYFTNKHQSSNGSYGEMKIVRSDYTSWRDFANYSTLNV